MPTAQAGDRVTLHYTARLEDGTVFADDEPITFTLGRGQVIPGVDEAVIGMAPGETKSTVIPADKGFGPHREEKVAVIDREEVPTEIDLAVGKRLSVKRHDGVQETVTVVDVTDSTVTLDGNHQLAGKTLQFKLTLVAVA